MVSRMAYIRETIEKGLIEEEKKEEDDGEMRHLQDYA